MATYRDVDTAVIWLHYIKDFEDAKKQNPGIKLCQWCKKQGINDRQFSYWRGRFMDDNISTEDDIRNGGGLSQSFVEVPAAAYSMIEESIPAQSHQTSRPVLYFRKNGISVELTNEADDRFLALIGEVVANA